jgi:hypothetical protein
LDGQTLEGTWQPVRASRFHWTVYDEDWRESINIRFFRDDVAVELPLANIEFIVAGQIVQNIRDYTLNVADWQTSTNAVFIDRDALGARTITVRATLDGQTLEGTWEPVRASMFHWTVYDEDWRESINIRFFRDDVAVEVPLANIEFVVDGQRVQNIRDYTLNVADWQTSTNAVFICRDTLGARTITVRATLDGQTLEGTWEPVRVPRFHWTVYDEDWRESINIRFFQDDVAAAVPLANIEFVVAGQRVQNIRDFTVNVADWQTSTDAVFISRAELGERSITVRVTLDGRVLEGTW